MIGKFDYVVVLRRPNGTPIYSTLHTIERHGLGAVRDAAQAQLRSELGRGLTLRLKAEKQKQEQP